MKKLLGIISVCLILVACKKDRTFEDPQMPVVPEQTGLKQGVLIEPTTSVSCGLCPQAHDEVKMIEADYDNVFHMSHYLWGPLSHEYTEYLIDKINKTVFTPLAHIDRKHVAGSVVYYQWKDIRAEVENRIINGTDIGLSITGNEADGNLNVTIEVELEDSEEDRSLMVSVFIVEKSVISAEPGYRQNNYGNDDPDHPYYQRGNPIDDFEHTNVIRHVLTSFEGDALDVEGGFGQWSGSIEISMLDEDLEAYSIIAFVNNTGTDVQPILNAALLEL